MLTTKNRTLEANKFLSFFVSWSLIFRNKKAMKETKGTTIGVMDENGKVKRKSTRKKR